jgi:DNA-binding transcriptional regulator PaaX
MSKNLSPIKQKILLLLLSGLAIGLTYSPRRHLKIIKHFSKEWKNIEEKTLNQEIRKLYQSKLVNIQENSDGILTLKLTENGKLKALSYNFDKMKINPGAWDKKWRIIVFDIPEKLRRGRDVLREKLKSLGFYELQKSVLVFPYECRDEIEFLVEFFNLRKYVRYGVLESIDNDLHLRKIFKVA